MADLVSCDVAWITDPDVHAVDALVRLQLAAQRRGCRLLLLNGSRELGELVGLMGLGAVLAVQVRRKPEQREEGVGVEEEGELDDAPA